MTPHITIGPLSSRDRTAWEGLAAGYKAFYNTEVSPEQYRAVWFRLLRQDQVFGLGAKIDHQLVGITHYLFHTTVWDDKVCYLQDLFVEPAARGKGIARLLIAGVADAAKEAGAVRCYWLTQERNATARRLYDRVAKFNGFIRYQIDF